MLSRLACSAGRHSPFLSRQPSNPLTPFVRHLRRRSGANGVGGGARGSPVNPENAFATPQFPPPRARDLVAPALFTAGFCGATLVGCSVWQYENMRSANRAKGWRGYRDQVKVGCLRFDDI